MKYTKQNKAIVKVSVKSAVKTEEHKLVLRILSAIDPVEIVCDVMGLDKLKNNITATLKHRAGSFIIWDITYKEYF